MVVNGVAFQGNTTYSAADLSGLIASEIGKPMTLKDIQGLADKVEAFYHDAGYPLVKVVVPRQTFADGKPVELVVLEGRLGKSVSRASAVTTPSVSATLSPPAACAPASRCAWTGWSGP